MSRGKYTPEFKEKIVLEVLWGERELGVIAAENCLNPNMVCNRKSEFLENASRIFEEHDKSEREARRKEAAAEKERDKTLKTIIYSDLGDFQFLSHRWRNKPLLLTFSLLPTENLKLSSRSWNKKNIRKNLMQLLLTGIVRLNV